MTQKLSQPIRKRIKNTTSKALMQRQQFGQNNKTQLGISQIQLKTPKFQIHNNNYIQKHQLSSKRHKNSSLIRTNKSQQKLLKFNNFQNLQTFRFQQSNINKNDQQSENGTPYYLDPKKQVLQTQNVPLMIQNQKISKLYLTTNIMFIILCIIQLILYLVSYETSLSVIILGGICGCCYIFYLIIFIKCTKLISIMFMQKGSEKYQIFFNQLKKAKTYFKIIIFGDKNNIYDEDISKELIYSPQIKDKSGNVYHIGLLQSYQKNQSNYQIAMIAIVKFHKKYCFSTDQSKNHYINRVSQFFNQNHKLFSQEKQYKGYKRIQYVIESFQNQKSYLLVNKKKRSFYHKNIKQSQQNTMKNNQKIKMKNQRKNKLGQLQKNQHSIAVLVLNNNDSIADQIQKYDDNQMSINQNQKDYNKNVIQPHNDKKTMNTTQSSDLKVRIISSRNSIQKVNTDKENQQIQSTPQATPRGKSQQQTGYSQMSQNQLQSVYCKYFILFKIGYWFSVLIGFGVFYQIWIERNFIKRYDVNITKEIYKEKVDIKM